MPKELFHFHQSRIVLNAFGNYLRNTDSRAFLVSTIFPDSFFYSPFPGYPNLGRSLHGLEGRDFTEAVKKLSSDTLRRTKPVLMGIGVHLFTDALWHPSINRAADIISQEFRWPRSASHTLLESFLQRCFLPERTEKGIIREMMGSTRLLPGIGPVLTQVTKELLEVLSVSSRGITQWKIYLTMNLHILFLLVLHHKAVSKTLWNRISSGNPPGDLTSILAPGRIYVTRFKEKIDHFREVADLFSRQFYSDRIRQLTTLFDGLLKVLQ